MGASSFQELNITLLETLGKGREGGVIVDPKGFENDILVPIVRTTTCYQNPSQTFQIVHRKLVHNLIQAFDESLVFNNALVEIYDDTYRKMGFHTDQSLDLEPNSWICLFSCYEFPEKATLRTLQTVNKRTGECVDILLDHNSAILFSTEVNNTHLHKIIITGKPQKGNGQWLGITFRLSRTFVEFVSGSDLPFLCSWQVQNKVPLMLANDKERREFYHYKSAENKTDGVFEYPGIHYTLSKSDLIIPIFT